MATRAVLTPRSAEFPSTAFPQLTTIHSTDRRPILWFDAATSEQAYWTIPAPQGLTGPLTLVLSLVMASATTGNVIFRAAVEAITDADAAPLPATASSFDTANSSATTAVPGTLKLFQITLTLTNADSAAAADYLRLAINRDAANGSDTATGDAGLLVAEFRDAA